MAIVVVVYYAMRVSRHHTDALVTRLFFTGRDHRLRALRDIAGRIDQIEHAGDVAPLTADYLQTYADIDAHVFVQEADDAFEPDPEWIALGVAFPMLCGGVCAE